MPYTQCAKTEAQSKCEQNQMLLIQSEGWKKYGKIKFQPKKREKKNENPYARSILSVIVAIT